MAGKILKELSQDEKARELYLQRRKWHLDKISSEKYMLNKGIKKGKEEIAIKLLAKNMPIGEIVELTGLTEEEIEELKED